MILLYNKQYLNINDIFLNLGSENKKNVLTVVFLILK